MSHLIQIITAQTPQHFSDAKNLIVEYVKWLNLDLSFQNFDQEMADLPKMYTTNDGGLFIAYLNEAPIGIVGLRRFSEADAEVKRMFVRDEAKGKGVGKLLLQKCIGIAKALHYRSIKLDTGAFMKAAIHLYISHGFAEIPAYRFNPHESAKYYELNLTK